MKQGNWISEPFMDRHHARSEIFLYGLMVLGVVAFCVGSVSFSFLRQDDLVFYYFASQEEPNSWGFTRLPLAASINQLLTNVMVASPMSARLVVVFAGMAPVSILAYIVYSRVLFLPKSVSFLSALLPQILPGQTEIPAYIIGSYMTWGLLFYFICVISTMRYLDRRGTTWLVGAVIAYFAAIETTEVAIFLAIPLFFLVFATRPVQKKSFFLTGIFAAAAGYKAIWTILNPYDTVTNPQPFDISNALDRTAKAIFLSLPNPGFDPFPSLPFLLLAFIFVSLCLVVLFPSSRFKLYQNQSELQGLCDSRKNLLISYTFGLIWLVSSWAPFTLSYFFHPRYVYPAAFGLNLVVIISLFFLVRAGEAYH